MIGLLDSDMRYGKLGETESEMRLMMMAVKRIGKRDLRTTRSFHGNFFLLNQNVIASKP